MSRFAWLERELEALMESGLLRTPGEGSLRDDVREVARSRGVSFVDASSNDYLGYGRHGVPQEGGFCGLHGAAGEGGRVRGEGDHEDQRIVSRETQKGPKDPDVASVDPNSRSGAVGSPAIPTPTPGSCASRLLGGTRREHTDLECQLSQWLRQESALLFSSGYAANVGILSSLPRAGDTIFSDALNHASIVDGCRLSKADIAVFPHRDIDTLHQLLRAAPTRGRRYIVTESYFSMDADTPDLSGLRDLADQFHAALIVDEAHALGAFGPEGAGLAAERRVQPDLLVGTLGKSIGLQGAFVAGPAVVKTWLWNRARPFVYSTATTPGLAKQALLHVKHLRLDERSRQLLRVRSLQLRQAATEKGLRLPPDSHGPIVPIILGENRDAIAAAHSLRANGILAYPLRPPTVPQGTSRIRLTVSAGMLSDEFDHLVSALRDSLDTKTRVPVTPRRLLPPFP